MRELLGGGINRKMQHSQELETIKCEEESPNADILVRLSVLLKGPLLERRKEIRKSFVLASLSTFKVESEFEIKDLSKSIKNITKCEIENEIIIAILNQLESETIIQHIDGLKYKLNQKIALPEFGDLTKSVWEEFVIYLKAQYKDYDPYIDRDAKEIFDLYKPQKIYKSCNRIWGRCSPFFIYFHQFFKYGVISNPPTLFLALTSHNLAQIPTLNNNHFPGRIYVSGVTAIASLEFPVNTSNHRINCLDVPSQAQAADMHCDYQDCPLKSYPVDPVHPVYGDFCPGFDPCRMLREYVCATN